MISLVGGDHLWCAKTTYPTRNECSCTVLSRLSYEGDCFYPSSRPIDDCEEVTISFSRDREVADDVNVYVRKSLVGYGYLLNRCPRMSPSSIAIGLASVLLQYRRGLGCGTFGQFVLAVIRGHIYANVHPSCGNRVLQYD